MFEKIVKAIIVLIMLIPLLIGFGLALYIAFSYAILGVG